MRGQGCSFALWASRLACLGSVIAGGQQAGGSGLAGRVEHYDRKKHAPSGKWRKSLGSWASHRLELPAILERWWRGMLVGRAEGTAPGQSTHSCPRTHRDGHEVQCLHEAWSLQSCVDMDHRPIEISRPKTVDCTDLSSASG